MFYQILFLNKTCKPVTTLNANYGTALPQSQVELRNALQKTISRLTHYDVPHCLDPCAKYSSLISFNIILRRDLQNNFQMESSG